MQTDLETAWRSQCKQDKRQRQQRRVRRRRIQRSRNEENYSEGDSDAYTFRLTHKLRAVKDKGTQWFVALNMKANDHSHDVKCSIDTGTTCNVMNYITHCKMYQSQDGDATLCKSSPKLRLYSTMAQQCFHLVKPP